MSEPVYMDRPAAPEPAFSRPPSMEQHAKEAYSLPAEWEIVSWELKGDLDSDAEFVEVKGGVYKTLFHSGKRKGKKNLRKPEQGTEATVCLTRKRHNEWLAAWERDTGLCAECSGTTWALAGWNHLKGSCCRPCRKCNATGRAQRSPNDVSEGVKHKDLEVEVVDG